MIKYFIVLLLFVGCDKNNSKNKTELDSIQVDTLANQNRIIFPPSPWVRPILISHKNFPLPDSIKSQGINGKVLLEFTVDTLGKVKDIKILKTDNPILNEFAIKNVLSYKFQPAMMKNNKVEANLRVPIIYE